MELMLALTLLATVAGIGTLGHGALARHTLRQQAETMLGILTEARATATRQGTPVRVAFSVPGTGGPEGESSASGPASIPAVPAIAARIFTKPADAAQIPITTQPVNAARHLPTAWLPGSLTELSPGLLGRWTALPSLPAWVELDAKLVITGDLLTQYQGQGEEAFARENLTLPPHFHGRPGQHLQGRECHWLSPYPKDYLTFPHPAYARPIHAPADMQETLPGTGQRLRTILGDRPILHFPASARALPKPLALPVIEFLPDGSLSATWTDEIHLRLTSQAVQFVHYDLIIGTRTGSIRLAD